MDDLKSMRECDRDYHRGAHVGWVKPFKSHQGMDGGRLPQGETFCPALKVVHARYAGPTILVRAAGGSTRLIRKRGAGSVGQCVPKDITEVLYGRPRNTANGHWKI